jgi:hypothetical protein
MSKTLLEDNSNGGAAAWDMGTGEEHGQPQPAAAPIAPGVSPWRHTSTPQPRATHGVQDAAGKLPDAKGNPRGGMYGGNMPDTFDENLPDDLQGLYSLIRQVDNYYFSEFRSRTARKEYLRRRHLIGEKIRMLSNGPKPIEMTADIIAGMQKAQHERPAQMNARLAEIQAYLASPITADPITLDLEAEASDPDSRKNLGRTPKTRLVLHPTVTQAVVIAKRLACAAEAFALDNFDLMNPVEYVLILERELRTSNDTSRIRELQTKISQAKETGSNRSAELSIKGLAADKWNPVFDALRYAILVSQLLVGSWEMEAMLVEEQWFGEFAIERNQTHLSKRFTDLRAELGKLNVSKTTFAWFGVNDIAESDE